MANDELYAKQTWVDGSAGGTPLSAARLDTMETAIEKASQGSIFEFADTTARDAELTAPRKGWQCVLTGLGDNGIRQYYDGAAWRHISDQLIDKITLGATGTITLTPISGFSKLVIRYSIRGVRAAANSDSLYCFIDGDTTASNYLYQEDYGQNAAAGVAEGSLPVVAAIPAATSPANSFGTGEIHITNYGEASRVKQMHSTFQALLDTDNGIVGSFGMFHDAGATDAIGTSLVLDGASDDLASGSWAELWGY